MQIKNVLILLAVGLAAMLFTHKYDMKAANELISEHCGSLHP